MPPPRPPDRSGIPPGRRPPMKTQADNLVLISYEKRRPSQAPGGGSVERIRPGTLATPARSSAFSRCCPPVASRKIWGCIWLLRTDGGHRWTPRCRLGPLTPGQRRRCGCSSSRPPRATAAYAGSRGPGTVCCPADARSLPASRRRYSHVPSTIRSIPAPTPAPGQGKPQATDAQTVKINP